MNVNSYWPDARAGNTADHELLVQPGTVARNGAEIPSHHLLIAGTGRAGTSFLVRYLTALGLDTNLTRNGERAHWDNRANAGLEDQLLPDPSQLPYVVKSPWTYQFIEELLGSGKVRLDAVVLPMRNLVESAASRSTVQMQAMHHDLSWIGTLERTWEEFGHASGGIVYSLNPVDQARLLAVGFHNLLEQLVKADIPVVLLSFPRIVEDADYLFEKIAPVLRVPVSRDAARRAHAALADPDKVRVGREIDHANGAGVHGLTLKGPSLVALERAALARELTDTRRERDALIAAKLELEQRLADIEASTSWRVATLVQRITVRILGFSRVA